MIADVIVSDAIVADPAVDGCRVTDVVSETTGSEKDCGIVADAAGNGCNVVDDVAVVTVFERDTVVIVTFNDCNVDDDDCNVDEITYLKLLTMSQLMLLLLMVLLMSMAPNDKNHIQYGFGAHLNFQYHTS